MKQFFVPEDFFDLPYPTTQNIASIANKKLEREGKVLYHDGTKPQFPDWREQGHITNPTHKALLINIEPIEKCKHPKEKIKAQPYCAYEPKENYVGDWQVYFECECGAKVKPTSFEEIE